MGLRFSVWGSGFEVWDVCGFGIQGIGSLGFRVWDACGFEDKLGLWRPGFLVYVSGCRVGGHRILR